MPRAPAARQAASTSAGTSKGALVQPSLSRAPLISSAPSGSPCVEALPCLVRRAVADDGLAGDQRRPVGAARALDRDGDRSRIVAVDPDRAPARGLEARQLIVRHGQGGRPVDGDRVVVEQHDQLVELEVARQRDRLVADAFHQAAVAGDHVGEVVDDGVAEPGIEQPLGQRHADGIGETLAQRARRGLDARRMAVLGMAGRLGAELAEVAQLVHRHIRIAGEMQQRVEQHRAVPGRQHEAVAVGPIGRRGVELQELGEQHRRHVGHAHRHARMPGLGLLDRIHGERADGVGHVAVQLADYRCSCFTAAFPSPIADGTPELARCRGPLAAPAQNVYLQRKRALASTGWRARNPYRLALIGS